MFKIASKSRVLRVASAAMASKKGFKSGNTHGSAGRGGKRSQSLANDGAPRPLKSGYLHRFWGRAGVCVCVCVCVCVRVCA